MRRSASAILAAALAAVLAGLMLAVPTAAQAAPGQAWVRVAHFSPDASYVDVYMVSLNRKQLFPNVFYKSVSAYWKVAAGPFSYEVRPAGADPGDPPAIRLDGQLAAGGAYTVAAVGRRGALHAVLLRDDLSPTAAGRAKVRFLDAAVGLPKVDVALTGGRLLARGLAFPSPSRYAQLAAGSYRVEVRRAGAQALFARGPLAVKAGTVTSVALLGGAGKPRELFAFGDATGARATPSGGIRTGAGGTAPRPPAGAGTVPTAAAGLALAGLAAARRARRGGLAVAALLAGGVALAACAAPAGPGATPAAPRATQTTTLGPPAAAARPLEVPGPPVRPRTAPTAPGFEVGALPGRLAAGRPSAPVRLLIPAIGVDTPLDRLGLDPGGAMQVPADFGRAGWFAAGPAPGQPGPAVLAGHVDSRGGPAVFFRLRELAPGDGVQVELADGSRLRFAVEGSRSYPKAAFPTAAVFGPTPDTALRLITCGGSFDRARGSYRDNLVVSARLVRVVP